MKRRLAAALVAVSVLAVTGLLDGSARATHEAETRAEVTAAADDLARTLSDVVVRESSAVQTLSAFVQIDAGDPERMAADFPIFAAALMEGAPKIRSVQLGPDSILEYVYPLEGNEQALRLDLMADPDRRALLEPAIESGETVIQGPVELVQGGMGLIVRRPVYRDDGRFWGFAAIVLDWPAIAAETGVDSPRPSMVAGVQREDDLQLLAGTSDAFSGEPITLSIEVGATATTWRLAMQPVGGWPDAAPVTPILWIAGSLIALLAGLGLYGLLGRPEALKAEREKALADLALAEARYQATFEHAGVGIAVTNTSGELISANRALRNLVGLTMEAETTGLIVTDFVHPDDLPKLRSVERKLAGGDGVVDGELRFIGPDGTRLCRVRVTTIGQRGVPFYAAVIEDITERVAGEAALARSEARYRHLFDRTPIAVQRQDYSRVKTRMDELRAEGVRDIRPLLDDPQQVSELVELINVTDANPAAVRLNEQLGSSSHRELSDLLTEEARESFIAGLIAVWDEVESVSIPVSPRTADGRRLHLELKWQPLPTVGGFDYSQVMVTITDVTRLTEIRERLEESLASKDQFLASVAHEVRTPLTAVVGFGQELRDNPDLSGSERDEFIALITQNAAEMSDLIEDLLVIARVEIGEVNINAAPVDLVDVARTAVKVMPDRRIPVTPTSESVVALADPGRVRQIVRNLVTNALRYGGDDVAVEVGANGEGAFIDVSDDGVELSASDVRRIFEPYQRLSEGAAAPGSIGLGLTVSLALARAQDGDLKVERRNGRNVFRLLLPRPSL